MTEEEFKLIIARQQSSGLSIKDFCTNESYTVSSFHYWKSKYGFCRPYRNHDIPASGIAPIRLTSSPNHPSVIPSPTNQLEIEHPGGLKIRLNNFSDLQSAILLFTQTLGPHVLPE